MMDLDARRLRVLHTVALRGSVTAAAATMCVSPSAISQQLAQLEREAGCDLVERAGRGITLTAAGQALARHAEDVIHALDRAADAVAIAQRGVSGTVHVGTLPSAGGAILAPAAARAHAKHPGLDVRIRESEDDASLIDLRLTALDMVIMQEYTHVPVAMPAGVVAHPIADQPLYLVTPPRLAGVRTVAELSGEPWIAAGPATPCGRSTRQACRDAGFEPDVRHIALDFAFQLDLVAAGLGVALVPELGLRHVPEGIRTRPTSIRRKIFAVVRETGVGAPRPAVTALLAELLAG